MSLPESTVTVLRLPAVPTTVGRARRAVRHAVVACGATDLADPAQLVISEIVTNAVVHAGTDVDLRITAERAAVRVEVADANPHLPVRRAWTETAGTGRGLLIVDEHTDRWGAVRTDRGKVVWFEIGDLSVPFPAPPAPVDAPRAVPVVLRHVPLLMHWAWQEHAAALLREYLLFALEREVDALEQHAAASDALRLLDEQLPRPQLPTDPEALMAGSIEPGVSADEVVLHVPTSSVASFEVLDRLLDRAIGAAADGELLGPPTQPEIAEMRRWLCGEVVRQARGGEPTAWVARTDVRLPLGDDSGRSRAQRELAASDAPLLATDDASVIVAVTPGLAAFLGYDDESGLLGRRILVVVPARFHQAHIAGTTLHATHGRDVLLDQWLTVPVVRCDGSEVPVGMRVRPRRLSDGERVFVAEFRLPAGR